MKRNKYKNNDNKQQSPPTTQQPININNKNNKKYKYKNKYIKKMEVGGDQVSPPKQTTTQQPDSGKVPAGPARVVTAGIIAKAPAGTVILHTQDDVMNGKNIKNFKYV